MFFFLHYAYRTHIHSSWPWTAMAVGLQWSRLHNARVWRWSEWCSLQASGLLIGVIISGNDRVLFSLLFLQLMVFSIVPSYPKFSLSTLQATHEFSLKNKSNRVQTTDTFSGELPAYLSLNSLLNGILSCSWCYFVRIRPISQKFNSFVTDQRTDGRTDGRTDTPSYRDARTHLKSCFVSNFLYKCAHADHQNLILMSSVLISKLALKYSENLTHKIQWTIESP